MKTIYKIIIILIIIIFIGFDAIFSKAGNKNMYSGNWKYFSHRPPGETPEVFAKGIISLGLHEHHLVISPDYREMFYVIADRFRLKHFIIWIIYRNGEWKNPQIASFSGVYSDFAPTYSHDGESLFFCSNRPINESDSDPDFNIWVIQKWSVL